jgi:hypothetical protein
VLVGVWVGSGVGVSVGTRVGVLVGGMEVGVRVAVGGAVTSDVGLWDGATVWVGALLAGAQAESRQDEIKMKSIE